MTYAQYRKLVTVHQDGAFLVARAAWPHMVRQNYGRMVFVTSLAAMPGLAHYASAKAALSGFARSLNAEGEGHGIRCNALSVMAYTRLMAPYFEPKSGHSDLGLHGQTEIEAWWRNYLRPEQVSQVAAWLSHELCNLSGQTIFAAGGQVSLQLIGLTQGHANVNITPEEIFDMQERILSSSEPHIHTSDRSDTWLFDRITSGGAPPHPKPRLPLKT